MGETDTASIRFVLRLVLFLKTNSNLNSLNRLKAFAQILQVEVFTILAFKVFTTDMECAIPVMVKSYVIPTCPVWSVLNLLHSSSLQVADEF